MSLLGSFQLQPRQHQKKKKKKPHPLIILEKNMPEKLKILFVWPNDTTGVTGNLDARKFGSCVKIS